MFGGRHRAKAGLDLPDGESLERKGAPAAFVEAGEGLAQPGAHVGGPESNQGSEINRKKGQVVLKKAQTQFGVLMNVLPAKFKEATARPEHGEARRDRLAGQRVEDHIYPFLMGGLKDFINPVERP